MEVVRDHSEEDISAAGFQFPRGGEPGKDQLNKSTISLQGAGTATEKYGMGRKVAIIGK